MSEFSAIANLEIRPTGMDAARREIERELGDLEVGVTANRPTGRGAVGASGPEPAGVDLSRRQLGQQEQLVDLATDRNEILEELLDAGGVGGGGGGGGVGGLGLSLAAGAGIAGAGSIGAPLATFGQRLGRMDLGNPLSLIFGGQAPGSERATRVSSEDSPFQNIPNIGINVPPALQQIAQGIGVDINIQSDFNLDMSESLRRSEQQRFEQAADRQEVESLVRSELQRFEQRLRQQLGGNTGPRTTSRSGAGTGGAELI